MHRMRIVLLSVGLSLLVTTRALASDDAERPTRQSLRRIAAELGAPYRPSVTATLSDTTWIGYTPGHFDAAKNWWSIYSGSGAADFGRPRNGQPGKGIWNWDEPVHGDSLQGWWPYRGLDFGGTTGSVNHDRDRPHSCLDFGNQANYVLNASRGPGWQARGSGPEPGWRTIGVDGVWHVDGGSTVAVPGAPAPSWTPLAGSRSAWMGLRAHGDVSHVDSLTRNAFNEDVLILSDRFPNSPLAADRRFPGYGGAMDQLLYRDIDLGGVTDTSLTIRFQYRTNLSTSSASSTRYGWFHHDPLGLTSGAVNPQPNNFISASDAGSGAGPADSFMVYVGAGVDGEQWRGSDGALHDVYDPKHRWFAEVLHSEWDPASSSTNPRPLYYRELLSVSGTIAPNQASFTIPSGILQRFLEKSPRIRLVFRVKTNRFYDDDDTFVRGFSSNGAGAAVVDDVRIQIGGNPEMVLGDFEALNAIDNDPAAPALAAWKSTGKPPAIHFHTEALDQVSYQDVCGQKGDGGRICDASFGILSVGDHDRNHEVGNQVVGDPQRDGRYGVMSPTIQFVDDDGNPETPNPMGLYGIGGNGGVGDIAATDDYRIRFNLYTGDMLGTTGLFWRFSAQCYPARVSSASPPYDTWSPIQNESLFFWDDRGPICTTYAPVGLRSYGILKTSNANGIPDSIRIGVHIAKLDYTFEVSTGSPYLDAPFIDNLSLGIVDAAPSLSVDMHFWLQDAFPANEDPAYPGNAALFDTTAALVKTGGNFTQDFSPYNVPGDSVVVSSSPGVARVDLVFRVLPGPGDYEPVGDGVGGALRRVPSSPATVTPGDGSWWDVLRQNPGEFASPNAATLMQNAPGGWDPNVWISARCDTADVNLYAHRGAGVRGGPENANTWMSMWHESDPRYDLLGILKNRCFVNCATCDRNDIRCDGTVPTYLPVGTAGTTREFTKIVPDGLLTPGAHVEYFFRAQAGGAPGTAVAMFPDSTLVFPHGTGFWPDYDGHRWQEFSVLPDRWKDPQYRHPVFQQYGHGPACLLVVDWADRTGDERVWVSVADTIGATQTVKFGAHNGWHARGDQDVNDPASRVAAHGGSPGTTWDLYQVKAAEGEPAGPLGARLSYRGGDPLIAAKTARNAPTPEMLDAYYSLMLILTGDLDRGILGPFSFLGSGYDNTNDDLGILEGWLQAGSTETPNRGLWIMGSGIVDALTLNAPGPAQAAFASDFLHVGLLSPDYRTLTQNTDYVLDLHVLPDWQDKAVGQRFGILSPCLTTGLDVLAPAGTPPGEVASRYEPAGGGSGHTAGIFKPWTPASSWMSLTDGFSIQNLTGFEHHNTTGRSLYFWKIFTNVFAQIWNVAGSVEPLDVPHLAGDDLMNFVRLLENPAMHGEARVRFGLARADRVEARVYDVTGRLVRVLADRQFGAGEHELVWDGLDRAGARVARGVYFTQFRFRDQGFVSRGKLTLLE